MSPTSKSLMGSDFSAMSFGLLHLKPRRRKSRLMVKMLNLTPNGARMARRALAVQFVMGIARTRQGSCRSYRWR